MVMADMDTVVMARVMAMAILHNKKEDSFQDCSERNKIDQNKKALQRNFCRAFCFAIPFLTQ